MSFRGVLPRGSTASVLRSIFLRSFEKLGFSLSFGNFKRFEEPPTQPRLFSLRFAAFGDSNNGTIVGIIGLAVLFAEFEEMTESGLRLG